MRALTEEGKKRQRGAGVLGAGQRLHRPPAHPALPIAAGSALQWLYYGRLAAPSDSTRAFYRSDAFRAEVAAADAAAAAVTSAAPGAAVLRGGTGSLYSFDQSLFVDGTVWSNVFGLSQVRALSAEVGAGFHMPPHLRTCPPIFVHRLPSFTSPTRA